MNRHYQSLELHKVLALLRAETTCEEAGALALTLEPVSDLVLAKQLMDQTEDAFQLLAKFGAPSFRGLKNVTGAVSRAASGGLLNPAELLDIGALLQCVRALSDWREHCAGFETGLDRFFEVLMPNKYLEERIHAVILSEDEVSDQASETLFDIRRRMKRASLKVREQLDHMVRSAHYQKFLQEPIVTQRDGRYVVPVKQEFRSEIKGLVHDTSASGATVFVEPMAVVEANNEIRVLQSKERAEIERILYELSSEAGSFSDSIRQNFETAVELNLIFAKAHLAYRMKASRPQLNRRGDILLKQARHPLLDPQQVVPTDIALGGDFDTLVITGPNTGGKTVSIKTIGLMTLMAMCGLLLPVADGSSISVFDRVLADIGDEQSIEQNLSTFSGHMTNIISVMDQADENSLILIDELGAGTDPVEGAALATAILEFLRERGAKIAATTHYAELKAYALQTPGVINGSCEFDVKTLRPTYKLLIGMPGRSNAFAISRRLGMDEGVVDRANSLISEEHRSFESVVAQMEQSRQSMEASRAEAQRLSAEAAQLSREAREAQSRMAQEREKELERARGEARRIIDAAKRQSQVLLEELDTVRRDMAKGATADQLRRAKSAVKSGLNRAEDAIAPVQALKADDGPYQLPRPVRAGDRVLVTGLNQEGEVLAPADKNGNVEIQAGLMKTRVKESTLRLLEGGGKKQKPSGRSVQTTSSRAVSSVSSRCDLRGRTVEEALMELDFFLDSAVMDGLGEITIIHGKGTGALRSAVQDHLRRHQQVDSYRLGTFGEGENGVTIATLK